MKRKSFVTAIVFVMLFTAVFSGLSFFNTGNAYASGIKATLSPDSSTTAIGSSVKVTLSYSGSSIGMIKATVTYDSNLLELTGGGDESCNVYGGGGYAVVEIYKTGAYVSCNLIFKALDTGTAVLSAETLQIADGDYNETTVPSIAETTVDIVKKNSQIPSQNPSNEERTSLSHIEVSCGELDPAFSPSVTEYTVHTAADETQFSVSAEASHSDSTVKISGSSEFTEDSATRIITVTDIYGNQKEYHITAIRDTSDDSTVTDDSQDEEKDGGYILYIVIAIIAIAAAGIVAVIIKQKKSRTGRH